MGSSLISSSLFFCLLLGLQTLRRPEVLFRWAYCFMEIDQFRTPAARSSSTAKGT